MLVLPPSWLKNPLPEGVVAAPKKWLRLFVAATLAAMWAIIACQVMQERAGAQREWADNMGNITRAMGENTLRTISAIDRDLKYVRNLYLRDGEDMDLEGLARIGGVDGLYLRLGVINNQGHYALSDRPRRPTTPRDAEDFASQASSETDELRISPPRVSKGTAEPSIHLTRRIVDEEGTLVGVAVAAVDPRFFGRLYSEVDMGVDGMVALAGEDGQLRARRENGIVTMQGNVSAAPMFSVYRHLASGTFHNTGITDGVRRFFAFQRLPGVPLIVVTGVAEHRIFERSNAARDVYIAMGAIATVLILLFAWAFSRLLSKQEAMLRELRVSQIAADAANRAKSEFLASMSHELRTPLNGVLGFADLLRRKGTGPEDRKKAEIIHTSGSHLLNLLNSILDLAKIEAGRMDIYRKREELAPLLRHAVEIYEISAAAKGLRLTASLEGALPTHIHCDPTLLRQVLNNLISNAIKFTSTGSVTVRVEPADAPGLLHFQVQDTGMGIPTESLHLAFERFRQVDQSLTRTHQGTGLGLPLAKQLVELMGGEISLASQPGKGTAVHFTLPVGEGAAKVASGEEERARVR